VIAHEFERVALFDKEEALIDQPFELDRFDFGAVLIGLPVALCLFVGIEIAFDAFNLAVEDVDERPEKIAEIVLEPGAGQHDVQGLDRRFQIAADDVGFGKRPEIGRIWTGAVPVKDQFVEQMRRRRCGVLFGIVAGKGQGVSLRDMAWAFLA
jgi:hypothetical protein